MGLYGFRDRETATILRKVAEERRFRTSQVEKIGFPKNLGTAAGGGEAGPTMKIGRLTADLGPGLDGTMTVWDKDGATTETIDVSNPHSITLFSVEAVIAQDIEGYDNWLASPYEYVICPVPQPNNVSVPV